MAEFLTTFGVSHHIENIILEAKIKLVLVSPYLQLSKTFYERLKDCSEQNVPIKIVYGKDDLNPNQHASLSQLKEVCLYYFSNLHAKCYYNEKQMVITSMNMYEFSEKNNREMGVLIDSITDKELYDKAVREAESIIQFADPIAIHKPQLNKKTTVSGNTSKPAGNLRGYCIRCEIRIEFDPSRPYCSECYSVWAQYNNPDYAEAVCHHCGKYEETSMDKPECYSCYSRPRNS